MYKWPGLGTLQGAIGAKFYGFKGKKGRSTGNSKGMKYVEGNFNFRPCR